MTAEYIASV